VHVAGPPGRRPEEAVRVIPAAELEPGRPARRYVAAFVAEAGDTHLDVDDGLGGQSWHRGGTHMLDAQRGTPEPGGQAVPPAPERRGQAWS
jgi:hypothetical protein